MGNLTNGRPRRLRLHRLRGLFVGPHGEAEAKPISSPTASASTRMLGLDALRSASMVAVVAVHAAYAYVAFPLPGLPWAIKDGSRSLAIDLVFWSSIGWAMPAFFALGGFAAAAIWSSKGPIGFARDRLRRIAAPAAVAMPLVLLPTLGVWLIGWLVTGRTNLRQIGKMVFVDREIRANVFGPAHLWFLEYLLLMLASYFVARLVARRPPSRPPGWVFSLAGPFLLAIPTTGLLWLGHLANGLDPIVDLRNSFVPNPFRWLHHAWFFAVGAWLFAGRDQVARFARLFPAFLAAALVSFGIRATLLRADLVGGLPPLASWASAASAALFGWLSLFGLIGLSLRLFDRPSKLVRYLSGSSYWIYLTHFPIVGLFQVALFPLPWPAPAKFLASLLLTLGFGILSYEGLARRTIIGRGLNGGRPHVPSSPSHAPAHRPRFRRPWGVATEPRPR